jgi:hypothetical protein
MAGLFDNLEAERAVCAVFAVLHQLSTLTKNFEKA